MAILEKHKILEKNATLLLVFSFLVVTIGGASVGDRDLVAPALRARGVDLDFWKVAMRPGKPVMAGRKGALRVVGLNHRVGHRGLHRLGRAVIVRQEIEALPGPASGGEGNDFVLQLDHASRALSHTATL